MCSAFFDAWKALGFDLFFGFLDLVFGRIYMCLLYAKIVDMVSETLSIRIRRDVKKRMRKLKDVDWRSEIRVSSR